MDYSGEFLSHARVYVLADYYNIPRLMELSTTKLENSLDGYLVLFSEDEKQVCKAIENFVELLEYSYANTVDKGGEQDLLRKVITERAATWIHVLEPHKEFQRALVRFGEMGKDIISNLLRQFIPSTSSLVEEGG